MSASSGQLHREDPLVLNDHANSSTSSLSAAGKEKLEKHEKELQKLLYKRERLNAEHAKHRAAEEAKLRRLQASASEEAAKRSARREREMEKASEKHRKAVEKLEARGRKERRRMENKEAKQREKEEKKLEEEEEEERKKNEKLNGEGLTAQEVRDLRERLLQAETWRKIVEARIARAVEAGGDDEKGSSRSRISAILEGVDAEVSDEIQRTRITAPSTTTLPPMSPP
jgi:DNA repair exonuclease SbcCD ATPase subunit